jgi:hypothetical protein
MRLLHRLIAMALGLLVSGIALADIDRPKYVAALQAADEFLTLAESSQATGQMPRQTDPKIKALLDQVFDRSVVGPKVWEQLVGITWMVDLLDHADRVGLVYMLAGTGQTSFSEVADDPKTMGIVERNTATYAPEIGRWLDYRMVLQGAVTDMVVVDLASAESKTVLGRPQAQQVLDKFRQDLARSIAGVFQIMSNDAMDDGWRRDRMVSLTELAPKAARLLSPDDAKELQDSANALAEEVSDPSLKASLESFGETITKQH